MYALNQNDQISSVMVNCMALWIINIFLLLLWLFSLTIGRCWNYLQIVITQFFLWVPVVLLSTLKEGNWWSFSLSHSKFHILDSQDRQFLEMPFGILLFHLISFFCIYFLVVNTRNSVDALKIFKVVLKALLQWQMNWPRTWKDASGGTYKSYNKGKLALYFKVNLLKCLNIVLSFWDYHVAEF